MANYNQPWHIESEFENYSRLLVGSSDSDHITAGTWSECRAAAEMEIISHITDSHGKNRLMLSRVPGELVPQHHPILDDDTNITFTLSVPDVVTTPSSLKPIVWKNLEGPWENRWACTDIYKLEIDTHYTLSGNTITFLEVNSGDRFCVEYGHTLNPVPPFLKQLSLLGTVERALVNKFGIDSSRVEKWADQHGTHLRRQLKMLMEGTLQIPEFASVNLYADWKENPDTIQVYDLTRG